MAYTGTCLASQKSKQTQIENKLKRIEDYYKSPKLCLFCNEIIDYKYKSVKKFCDSSCAAKYNNSGRIDSDLTKKKKSEATHNYIKRCGDNRIKRSKPTNNNNVIAIKEKYRLMLISWFCPVCGKELKLTEHNAKKRKYCSGTCRNKINNKILTGKTSKAEQILKEVLIQKFPSLNILFNDRTTLNGLELDVHIPELKFAIEWNGIYHLKKVRTDKSYERIKNKDKQKKEMCFLLGIDLLIVEDYYSQKTFIKNTIENIINIIETLLKKQHIRV